jgi:hypothetical protein
MTKPIPQRGYYYIKIDPEMEKIYRYLAGNGKLEKVSRRYYEDGHVTLKFSFTDPRTGRTVTKAMYVVGTGTGFDGKVTKKHFFPKNKKEIRAPK